MMTKNGIQNSIAFTGKAPRKGMRIPLNKIKYNEQRDEEKGRSGRPFASERADEARSGIPFFSDFSYTYFGARYMDYELMASFISVDRYADKYPFISPYAYCAWTRPTGGHEHRLIKFNAANNPVKLVDQKGDSLDIAGGTIAQNDILSIVCPEYRTRISFNGNKVCVNVDGLTQGDIEKDAGFLTLEFGTEGVARDMRLRP